MKYNRKLSDSDVKDIINKYQIEKLSCSKIAKLYNVHETCIRRWIKIKNVPKNSQSRLNNEHGLNENYFEKIDTEDKAYFLGLLYADGCVNLNNNKLSIGLQKQDKNILEVFKQYLDTTRNLRCYKYKNINHQDQFILTLRSKKICNDLFKLGCIPNKSLILKFPELSLIPNKLFHHFIRGYFDGDGSFGLYKPHRGNGLHPQFNIVSTKDFCESLKTFLEAELKITAYLRPANNNKITYRFHYFKHNDIYKFLEYIYQDATIFLNRKYKKFLEFKKYLERDKN
jgi:hypothetical protein